MFCLLGFGPVFYRSIPFPFMYMIMDLPLCLRFILHRVLLGYTEGVGTEVCLYMYRSSIDLTTIILGSLGLRFYNTTQDALTREPTMVYRYKGNTKKGSDHFCACVVLQFFYWVLLLKPSLWFNLLTLH